jgi:amino-acid N-acetyltransferase
MGPLRTASKKDIAQIMALMKEGVREGMLVKRGKKEIAQDIGEGDCFVYEEKGKIIGMVFLSIYSERIAELRSLFVERGHRGNDIGSLLVKQAVKRAKQRKIKELMSITKARNEAWFNRLGFRGELHNLRIALFKRLAK